jgi:biopolymer transport protein ExbD
MKLQRRNVKRGRVEIIPMIDTILILLIFYMSFSSFSKREKRMDCQLPLRSPALEGVPEAEFVLHVRNQNEILVNGHLFDLPTVRATLQALGASDPRTRIIIEADADTKYQAIVNALDACAQAKLTKVGFCQLPDNA